MKTQRVGDDKYITGLKATERKIPRALLRLDALGVHDGQSQV